MTVQDRLLEMLATFANVDMNAIHPQDLLREKDGGLLEEEEILAFLDEAEGEFGIKIDPLEQDEVTTVEELLDFLSALIEERMMNERDFE